MDLSIEQLLFIWNAVAQRLAKADIALAHAHGADERHGRVTGSVLILGALVSAMLLAYGVEALRCWCVNNKMLLRRKIDVALGPFGSLALVQRYRVKLSDVSFLWRLGRDM